jgi:hypothetical protein
MGSYKLFSIHELRAFLPITVLLLLLSLLTAPPVFSQENLSLGRDLRQYLDQHPPTFKTEGPTIIKMREGKIDFYKYRQKTTEADLKILTVNDKYPIGVLQRTGDKDIIFLDMMGSGKLDTEFPILFVPYWVVAESTPKELKTYHNNVFHYLEGFFQSFQADTDPFASGGHKKRMEELLSLMSNDNLENRDLIYVLYCYYFLGNTFPRQALEPLHYLTNNYLERFDTDHPLLYLQTLETQINLGDDDGARKILRHLLEMKPDFIPGLAYQWRLEKDPKMKEKYYKELKRKYPNHWIVKTI